MTETACYLYVCRLPGWWYLLRMTSDDHALVLRCETHDINMPLDDTSPENILAVANAHRRGARMARGPIS